MAPLKIWTKLNRLALLGALTAGLVATPLLSAGSGAAVTVTNLWAATSPCSNSGVSGDWCEPVGLAYDTTSNSLYLSDWDFETLGQFSLSGQLQATMTTSDASNLVASGHVAAFNGNLSIDGNHKLLGVPTSGFPSGGAGVRVNGLSGSPGSLAYDASGNLFFFQSDTQAIYEVPAGSSAVSQVSASLGQSIPGLTVGPDGALYFPMTTGPVGEIDRLVPGDSTSSPSLYASDTSGNLDAGMGGASGLVFASDGSVFFSGANGIAKVEPSTGSPLTSASIVAPLSAFTGDSSPNLNGIAIDPQGNLYVADEGNVCGIYKIEGAAPAPTTTTTSGGVTPITPADGKPLELAPGAGAMINPDRTVTTLDVTNTGPNSIKVGNDSIGMALQGSSATGSKLTLDAGSTGTTSGYGFEPGSTVTIFAFSTPVTLGTATVGEDGTFTTSFPVPTTLTAGNHTIQAQGTGQDGNPRALLAGVTIGGLAATGASSQMLASGGVLAVLLGAAVVLSVRRRTRRLA